MTEEINTGGGSAIRGNANTGGGDFTGRDGNRAAVNISYENNQYLQFIRDELTDVKVRVQFIEQNLGNRDSDARQRSQFAAWLQIANLVIAVAMIAALIYFANSFYTVSEKLQAQQNTQQRQYTPQGRPSP